MHVDQRSNHPFQSKKDAMISMGRYHKYQQRLEIRGNLILVARCSGTFSFMKMRNDSKGRHRIYRKLMVCGLAFCIVANVWLARLHVSLVGSNNNNNKNGSETKKTTTTKAKNDFFSDRYHQQQQQLQRQRKQQRIKRENNNSRLHNSTVSQQSATATTTTTTIPIISTSTTTSPQMISLPTTTTTTTTTTRRDDVKIQLDRSPKPSPTTDATITRIVVAPPPLRRHKNQLLPLWMQQYMAWHETQRALLTETNYDDFKYMIMICRKGDKCGGTADRLKPFLLLLLIAFQTKRLFFIVWEQPCPLEHFLVPPQSVVGRLDWRLPYYLLDPLIAQHKRPPPATTMIRLIRSMNYTKARTIHVRYQSYDAGSEYYNQYRPNGPEFQKVYRPVWHMLFTPVPAIATRIQTQLQELSLVPGHYAAAHVRAFRGVTTRPKSAIRLLTILSLNCVSQLIPQQQQQHSIPIFFTSDSSEAVQFALEYGRDKNATIVARKHETKIKNPLHLEKSKATTTTTTTTSGTQQQQQQQNSSTTTDPSAYYDTFVDLYLLSMSHCMSFNIGGFGHWGSLLSYNSSCSYRYGTLSKCEWNVPTSHHHSLP